MDVGAIQQQVQLTVLRRTLDMAAEQSRAVLEQATAATRAVGAGDTGYRLDVRA